MLLTTQYLEEADRFADVVHVLHHGKIIASGTPASSSPWPGGEGTSLDDAFLALTGTGRSRHGGGCGRRRRPRRRCRRQVPLRCLARDSALIAGRNLRVLRKNPGRMIYPLVQPLVLLVMFVSVFGNLAVTGHAGGGKRNVPRVPHPRHHHRERDAHRADHGAGAAAGREQRARRPVPVAAHGPRGRARRAARSPTRSSSPSRRSCCSRWRRCSASGRARGLAGLAAITPSRSRSASVRGAFRLARVADQGSGDGGAGAVLPRDRGRVRSVGLRARSPSWPAGCGRSRRVNPVTAAACAVIRSLPAAVPSALRCSCLAAGTRPAPGAGRARRAALAGAYVAPATTWPRLPRRGLLRPDGECAVRAAVLEEAQMLMGEADALAVG